MKYKNIRSHGEKIPAIGQGTGIGGFFAKSATYGKKHEEAIRYGLDLGMTLIDTAEEYGQGEAEKTVGRVIQNIRGQVFIASKVSSENLKYQDVISSLEGSLKRLGTDYIDLYQIHWPNPLIPLEETMKAMEALVREGKIRFVGVCNFRIEELKQAVALFGDRLVAMQAEYNLFDRTIEMGLLPYCDDLGLLTIAYSPLDQG